MKRFKITVLSLGLAAVVLGLSACNSNDDVSTDTDDETYSAGESGSQDYDENITAGQENEEDWIHPWTDYQVIVNGEPIPGAFHHIADDGYFPTHVTLMPVLAALGAGGISVDDGEITLEGLSGTISFEVWSDAFTVDDETITLFYASIEIDGTIYVPIAFFRDVYGMGRAIFYSGHVMIDDEISDME